MSACVSAVKLPRCLGDCVVLLGITRRRAFPRWSTWAVVIAVVLIMITLAAPARGQGDQGSCSQGQQISSSDPGGARRAQSGDASDGDDYDYDIELELHDGPEQPEPSLLLPSPPPQGPGLAWNEGRSEVMESSIHSRRRRTVTTCSNCPAGAHQTPNDRGPYAGPGHHSVSSLLGYDVYTDGRLLGQWV